MTPSLIENGLGNIKQDNCKFTQRKVVCGQAALEKRKYYGLMFHPEVVHTPDGAKLIRNFVRKVAGLTGDCRAWLRYLKMFIA